MSKVYFISDLHFGHKNIIRFEPYFRTGDDCIENMHTIISNWNSVIQKRDVVYVLGDVAFSKDGVNALRELRGRKKLILGNHDQQLPQAQWLDIFESVSGLIKKDGYWISHAPIHPAELRGCKNIHGHVHSASIRDAYGKYDDRYINVCCEAVREFPIRFDDIKSGWYWEQKPC